jgi:Protein of unknown function (DUF4065)
MAARYDERKFAELLLYVAQRLEGDPAGGATKLNKVLFYAEFAAVRAQGRPITGVQYQKLDRGPAPRALMPIRNALVEHGDAELVEEPYLGYLQHRLVAKRQADRSLFNETELAAVDQVVADLWGRSATGVSELSHREMGWRMVDYGETIPYETAYLRPPVVTPAVREHAAALAERLGQP